VSATREFVHLDGEIDYETIKAAADARGCKVADLLALAPKNDPFYAGSPAGHMWGRWFADLWERFGMGPGTHNRRVHYVTLSQEPPPPLPDGKPYLNTDTCWNSLGEASKKARYLHEVDADEFDDRRNPDPIDHTYRVDTDPFVYLTNREPFAATLPPFPDLPSFELFGYEAEQRYHLELWCEKSTINDVLEPLAREYGAVLQTGVGELSITRTLRLVQRIAERDKPARIFYISDFDPAGQSMPVAVATKVEFFLQDLGIEADIRIFPVALTQQQCIDYRLPRTPIKDTELRAARFEERFGEGATELDALEALHPGELARLLRAELDRYFDHDLDRRMRQAREELAADLESAGEAAAAPHEAEIAALHAEYEQFRSQFEALLGPWMARYEAVRLAVIEAMEDAQPDLTDYPIPEPEEADEDGVDPLFDSYRDYEEQLAAFKEFQGKEAPA
jgi:hypothetical protein